MLYSTAVSDGEDKLMDVCYCYHQKGYSPDSSEKLVPILCHKLQGFSVLYKLPAFQSHITVGYLVHGVLLCQVHLDTVLRFHMAFMHPHNHNTSLEFPPCSLSAPREMKDYVSLASRLALHIAALPSVQPHSLQMQSFLFCL